MFDHFMEHIYGCLPSKLSKYAPQFSDNAVTFKDKKKNINFQVHGTFYT